MCDFPCSLRYKDYPEEAYTKFVAEMEIIKNENISNNEKWDRKFNLIKSFIETNRCFPYWYYKYLGCNTNGKVSIKTPSIQKYRSEKLQLFFRCSFIKENGMCCTNHIPSVYDVKKNPFRCTYHLNRCPNCSDWVDSRGSNKKYDNYCARCFKRLFPDDERSLTIYEHSKEIMVRNAISKRALIDERFKHFIHDTPLYTGNCDCTHRRRIDHRKIVGNTILAVETDEFAHKGYDLSDESIRYDDLFMIHSGKWIFVRFNPDNTKECKAPIDTRIITLLEEIDKQIQRIENDENTELIEIIKLYY